MNKLSKMCGITSPIFQAGMAGLARPELAASVSQAGGLGHLGGLRVPPEELYNWIADTKKMTSKPFGVNLVPQCGDPEAFEASFQVVLETQPAILSLFYGDFMDIIPRARNAGIITMVQVGSVAEASQAISYGANIIIAQGIEAGGHIRGSMTILTLLPSIVDIAGNTPVIAAGAIHDQRTVRAVRCLGAQGVWCGTAFLASKQSYAHDGYKQRLIAASGSDTKLSFGSSFGWEDGTPHRAIFNNSNSSVSMAGGVKRNDPSEKLDELHLYAGQGVGAIQSIEDAKSIVERLAQGFADN
ncbi:MAG: nitronate monooxygenase [Alphaproteobacteria bacterium]|nr:nitronate monooxygenase [Alphaproteobacteria bacterium]